MSLVASVIHPKVFVNAVCPSGVWALSVSWPMLGKMAVEYLFHHSYVVAILQHTRFHKCVLATLCMHSLVPRPPPFLFFGFVFCALQLPCIILKKNRRTKTGRPGNEASVCRQWSLVPLSVFFFFWKLKREIVRLCVSVVWFKMLTHIITYYRFCYSILTYCLVGQVANMLPLMCCLCWCALHI